MDPLRHLFIPFLFVCNLYPLDEKKIYVASFGNTHDTNKTLLQHVVQPDRIPQPPRHDLNIPLIRLPIPSDRLRALS